MMRVHSRSADRRYESVALSLLVAFSLLLLNVHGAHSRRRIVIRRGDANDARYDRSITTFSSDGRLAQVEYGMQAALKGSTLIAMRTPHGACWIVPQPTSSSTQQVSLLNTHKVHRLDHHVWLLTAGLSGDARALAQSLRQACQNHRLSYGEAPTITQVAHLAGGAQHELTRMAGARPLGCTAMVLGKNVESGSSIIRKPLQLFQTDPGGIVEECPFAAVGQGHKLLAKDLSEFVDAHSHKQIGGDSMKEIAEDMAQWALRKLEEHGISGNEKGPIVLDVWTLEPNPKRRGELQATCYRGVDQDSLHEIFGDS